MRVKGKYILKYDLIDYAIKYDGGGFWLYIDNLEGYFNFNNGIGYLEIMFEDAEQERLYDRIWDQIIDNADNNGGIINDIKKIRLNGDELPLGNKFKINNVTIVIKALVKKNDIYYPKISLNNSTYEVQIIKMLEYDRIDVNEGIDTNKNILTSKKSWLCGYWYSVNKNFNYQKYMCNGCHDLSMKAISIHNLCIGYNNGNAYRINFVFMSKNDALKRNIINGKN